MKILRRLAHGTIQGLKAIDRNIRIRQIQKYGFPKRRIRPLPNNKYGVVMRPEDKIKLGIKPKW